MGHFYCHNISRLVVRYVYAKGRATLRQMTDSALRRREKIHAAEGSYNSREMLEQGIETLLSIHIRNGVLEPIFASDRQREVWFGYWNHAFDWEDPEYQEVADTPVRFAPGMRRRYLEGKVQHIGYIDQ